MQHTVQQLYYFYWVASFLSFTKAAKHLGCSKAHLSKQIHALEQHYGQLLFQRNTRNLSLTHAGQMLFHEAKHLYQITVNAEQCMLNAREKIGGVLRYSAPKAFSECILQPALPEFLSAHPDLLLEAHLTGELLDLITDKIDVAIRLTHTPPLDRVAKKIGEYQFIVCASPEYLSRSTPIHVPEDLHQHRTLCYSSGENSRLWSFERNGVLIQTDIHPVFSSNDFRSVLACTLAGNGVARLPCYTVSHEIQKGTLIPILQSYQHSPIPIHAIYTKGHHASPPNTKAFLEFVSNAWTALSKRPPSEA